MEPLSAPADGNQNRAPALLAIFFVPFVFTVAVICARLFVRYRLRNLGLEDHAMFAAWVSEYLCMKFTCDSAHCSSDPLRNLYLTCCRLYDPWGCKAHVLLEADRNY